MHYRFIAVHDSSGLMTVHAIRKYLFVLLKLEQLNKMTQDQNIQLLNSNILHLTLLHE